jgi:hypothetical protein
MNVHVAAVATIPQLRRPMTPILYAALFPGFN